MKIKDIARLANVSPSTVSLVLNNKEGVGEETRKRIKQLLVDHDYTVSRNKTIRKNIRFLKYNEHGMVVEENEGFISSIIDQIEQDCRTRGFNLIITAFNRNNVMEITNMIHTDSTDGIILLGTELNPKMLSSFQKNDVPLVVVDNYMRYHDVDSIVMNNDEIAYTAVKHLFELGHTQIGFFDSHTSVSNFDERQEGFFNALKIFGLSFNQKHVFRLTPTLNGACKDMKQLISNGISLPSAVFSVNDTVAIGAIKALKQAGYKIPEDISIMGVDDIPFCSVTDPPLTTMRVPRQAIGSLAVDRLCARMENNDMPSVKVQVGAKLIQRKSTGVYSG